MYTGQTLFVPLAGAEGVGREGGGRGEGVIM